MTGLTKEERDREVMRRAELLGAIAFAAIIVTLLLKLTGVLR